MAEAFSVIRVAELRPADFSSQYAGSSAVDVVSGPKR
jgi:hypothetical protein